MRTGNFKDNGNSPIYPARKVFDDVEKAVDWIIKHEDHRYENVIKAEENNEVIDEKDEKYYQR